MWFSSSSQLGPFSVSYSRFVLRLGRQPEAVAVPVRPDRGAAPAQHRVGARDRPVAVVAQHLSQPGVEVLGVPGIVVLADGHEQLVAQEEQLPAVVVAGH